jgi:GMP synthase (glutamine-hydrolysing)
VRILSEVTSEKVEIARHADHIFITEIRKAGLYDKISQAYTAVDPGRAVGVMGDQRQFGYAIILRAVTTQDFMTAEACEYLNPKLLLKLVSCLRMANTNTQSS